MGTFVVVVLLLFGFAKLGAEVLRHQNFGIDMSAIQMAGMLRSSHVWLTGVMRDLSGMGSTAMLTLVTTVAVVYLALIKARGTAVLVASAVISGSLLVNLFKTTFGRLRPELAFAAFQETSPIFPSGHASMSAVVFLILGTLMASTRPQWSQRVFIFAVSALLTAMVGVSRIALGVHWATDVFGGWAFGVAWSMIWLSLAQSIGRRSRRQLRGSSSCQDACGERKRLAARYRVTFFKRLKSIQTASGFSLRCFRSLQLGSGLRRNDGHFNQQMGTGQGGLNRAACRRTAFGNPGIPDGVHTLEIVHAFDMNQSRENAGFVGAHLGEQGVYPAQRLCGLRGNGVKVGSAGRLSAEK